MTAITYEVPILLSSDPAAGASNISADGSTFEVVLDEPIEIPRDAVNCSIRSDSQSIWWTVNNIITGVNDKIYIDDNATPYVLTIDAGLYDLSSLNQAIDRELVNAGGTTGTIDLLADTSTQKVLIRFNATGIQIDFTQAETFRVILGYNSRLSPLAPSAIVGETDTADNVAAFNQIDYFLIHSDIVNQGIRINNSYNGTVARVLIDVPPGSQITATPFNPTEITAQNLIGSTRGRIRVWLTDQSNNLVNTNGEIYSVSLILSYTVIIR